MGRSDPSNFSGGDIVARLRKKIHCSERIVL